MLRPVKRLGQNFLRDPNTCRRIVAALPGDGPIVEIGPGTGALTGMLMGTDPCMTAIEVDERAVSLLRQELPGLHVRHEDVLKTDWAALASERGAPLHVIGNLPYYITTPILFSLLDAPRGSVRWAVVMMQKEVARRIVAEAGNKVYGILSVILQKLTRPELLFDVSRNVFHPKPDVTSSVVRFSFDVPELEVDPSFFRTVVRTAFNQRRKTLRNSLSGLSRVVPEEFAGLRAEALSPDDFVTLTRYLAG
ncbi:MAG: ribosomal RNA small subunit methyltransferase A [Rhodothermales bacterium]|nr:ribosomal RNA small subunit methyltransferase A [Rhodothermales bacterium]MBO6779620.1 ribosomal RNA small subunit methyltransferase A [Rhodothermales bacterium]